MGLPGGFVGYTSDFGSGHDLMVLLSSSHASGSVLTAWSLEPASDSVFPSLSAPPPLTLCLCLSKINIEKKNFFKSIQERSRSLGLESTMKLDDLGGKPSR